MATLMTLPTEIRLQILAYVVVIGDDEHTENKRMAKRLFKDYHNYDSREGTISKKHRRLEFRNIDALRFQHMTTLTWPRYRTCYDVRCDRWRARILSTTYECVNKPYAGISIGPMLVNKRIHEEATRLLYSGCIIDFDTHVEAISAFITDFSPFALSTITSISLVKKALAYEKEYDRCEWSHAMSVLCDERSGLKLHTLHIGFVAGRPGEHGWDDVEPYTLEDFARMKNQNFMPWLNELLGLQGLTRVNTYPITEHCPPASSSAAMAHYIRFSASIQSTLTDFLRSEMQA